MSQSVQSDAPMEHYSDYLPTLEKVRPELVRQIRGFVTLEHVLDWLKRENLPLQSLDMITQDEYCHDLLIPLPDSAWLVFSMT